MEIKEIQSQILINRQNLAGMYDLLNFYKAARKVNDKLGQLELEYKCHNHISALKPKIAQLVVLQKALKKDRAGIILNTREAKDYWQDIVNGCVKAVHTK